MDNNLLSIRKAAEYLDVTEDCLRKWDAANKLKPLKTAGGHRRYRKEDLDKFIGINEENVSNSMDLSSIPNDELLKEIKRRMKNKTKKSNMKKILVALMLCMVSIMGFGESYYWEKKVLPTVNDFHPDGDYIICYETANGKVKIFKDFTTQALTVSKVNDSTIMCDDSLRWAIERIENRYYSMQNTDGFYISTQYEKTEYGTLEYTTTYGLVNITNTSQIWSFYNGGIWQCIFYDKTDNMFKPYTRGNANISLYARTTVATSIDNINNRINGIKYIIDGIMYIIRDGNIYNILGQKVN